MGKANFKHLHTRTPPVRAHKRGPAPPYRDRTLTPEVPRHAHQVSSFKFQAFGFRFFPRCPSSFSLLVPLKSPATHLPPPLAFSLAETLTWHPDPIALEVLAPPPDPVLQQTADFLRTLLADGPKGAREIQNIAELNVVSRSSLQRAKTFLKIKPFQAAFHGPWFWSLPGDTRKPRTSTFPQLPDDVNALTRLLGVMAKK